jgi:hypothetical protein
MLRHLLVQHTHREGAESRAAIFLLRTHAPETGGLSLPRDGPEFVFGNFGGVRIKPALDRDDLVADDPPHLLPQGGQFLGKHKTLFAVLHRCITSCFDAPRTAARVRRIRAADAGRSPPSMRA